jgi:hypothetical protein
MLLLFMLIGLCPQECKDEYETMCHKEHKDECEDEYIESCQTSSKQECTTDYSMLHRLHRLHRLQHQAHQELHRRVQEQVPHRVPIRFDSLSCHRDLTLCCAGVLRCSGGQVPH